MLHFNDQLRIDAQISHQTCKNKNGGAREIWNLKIAEVKRPVFTTGKELSI